MKLKKAFLWITSIILFLIALIHITDSTYVYTALRYTTAGINDRDIFEQRIIKATDGIEWNIGKDYNTKDLPDLLTVELEELETIAFLVIQDDSIRYEKYWNEGSINSLTSSFSMAKSIVSILTGIALKEGKIKDIDDPVGNYLPEFTKGDKSEITVKHLLTMSSGLDWWEVYYSPVSHTTESYYGTDLKKLINRLEVVVKPGSLHRYKSCDTQVLAFVLESATGKSLSEYAANKLWQPINAINDAEWSVDNPEGIEKAYCCFNSNARDFARIGKLYLNNGIWNGQQIVPEDYVNTSIIPASLKDKTGSLIDYYGYSWWLIDHKGKWFYARGILGQYIMVLPEKKLIVVRLGHSRRLNKINNHPPDVYTIIDGVREIY
ncbi:MAG: serine hydrolase [Bacteroidia bacterium]|nr:serine hydrolase [Bacteroidia bacterium]